MKMIYNGCFLTEEARAKLAAWWRVAAAGEKIATPFKVHGHHMTSYFRPKGEEKDLPYGEKVELTLIGYRVTDELGVAVVKCETPSKNTVKHITIWTAEGVSPAKSNQVLAARGWIDHPSRPRIEAVVGWFNGKEVITSAPSE